MTRNQSCILRALLFVFFIISFLTRPVSAESLAHIVSKSDAVVQAHVSQISMDVDEHNAPVDIVSLQVTEVIVGEIDTIIKKYEVP